MARLEEVANWLKEQHVGFLALEWSSTSFRVAPSTEAFFGLHPSEQARGIIDTSNPLRLRLPHRSPKLSFGDVNAFPSRCDILDVGKNGRILSVGLERKGQNSGARQRESFLKWGSRHRKP